MIGLLLRTLLTLYLFSLYISASSVKKVVKNISVTPDWQFNVHQDGEKPLVDEKYVCTAQKVRKPGYAVAFRPTANADRVHHMLLFGCSQPPEKEGKPWDCERYPVCKGQSKILYAWARNAPALTLPKDVGFAVGFPDEFEYIVLQTHYAMKVVGDTRDYTGVTLDMMAERPKYVAAVYLFVAGMISIPPETSTFYMNMTCKYRGETELHPFAFRTHTHGLGAVVSAGMRRGGEWRIIGKRNPQWPQMFQPIDPDKAFTIKNGDVLAGQCRFNSTGHKHAVGIGMHGDNEMCNFYMMYYRKSSDPLPEQDSCSSPDYDDTVFKGYPADASALLPPKPELEEHAKQSKINFGVVEVAKWRSTGKVKFGEISAVSLDNNGNLVVFHRGDTIWDMGTFDDRNVLRKRESIPVNTVLTLDSKSGKLLTSWGKNRFYMPHGITVDKAGNVWLTDVGLHQVMKFVPSGGNMKEAKVWGEQFVPGNDKTHFCKPAAVAVTADGSFFVADGYCNSRIVKFGADGNYITHFGTLSNDVNPPLGTFLLPHDVVLHEEKQHLIVSDRENGRIQMMHFNGTPLYEVKPPQKFLTVYSSDYCPGRDTLFMIPGVKPRTSNDDIEAFAALPSTRMVAYSWKPTSGKFEKPHILRVTKDCRYVWVGEIRPTGGVLWKFEIKRDSPLPKKIPGIPEAKAGTVVQSSVSESKKSKPAEIAVETPHTVLWKDPGMWKFVVVVGAAVGVPLLLITLCCLCLRFRKQGGFRQMNMMMMGDKYFKGKEPNEDRVPLFSGAFGGRSHKGFQPLSTEDMDAIDDLTDDSEAEDTLYPPKRNYTPSKA